MASAKQLATELLKKADIEIGGSRPGDITVHDESVYNRVLAGGTLALGESYMDGAWDANGLDVFISKVMRARLDKELKPSLGLLLTYLWAQIFNQQTRVGSQRVAREHYDLGNDLYEAMLDPSMTYTCGYWKDAKTLQEAQDAKHDLICRKIGLKKGDRVLDIGCGWGSFLKFAAEKYGAEGVGVTISNEQAEYAREFCKGLPVEIRIQDYRDVNEKFDHIISIGMFEHVGVKNYRTYFEVANRCLKDDGFFLLHTIGQSESHVYGDPWLSKYIFPNSVLPSPKFVTTALEDLFVMEDWHNFGPYYDTTLMAWFENFRKAWPELKEKYDERFYRMWEYYLLMCAGLFRARSIQLWQIVLSKNGVPGGYISVR